MNNAKLTPAVILVSFAVLALLGPAEQLHGITRDQLVSQNFWLDILAGVVGSIADSIKAVVVIVAGAFGLPIIRSANSPTTQIVPTPTVPTDPPKP